MAADSKRPLKFRLTDSFTPLAEACGDARRHLEALHENAQAVKVRRASELLPIGLKSPEHPFKLRGETFDRHRGGHVLRDGVSRGSPGARSSQRHDQRGSTVDRALQDGNQPVEIVLFVSIDYRLPSPHGLPDLGIQISAGRDDLTRRRAFATCAPVGRFPLLHPVGRLSGVDVRRQGIEGLGKPLGTKAQIRKRLGRRLVPEGSPVVTQTAKLPLKPSELGKKPISVRRFAHLSRLSGEA